MLRSLLAPCLTALLAACSVADAPTSLPQTSVKKRIGNPQTLALSISERAAEDSAWRYLMPNVAGLSATASLRSSLNVATSTNLDLPPVRSLSLPGGFINWDCESQFLIISGRADEIFDFASAFFGALRRSDVIDQYWYNADSVAAGYIGRSPGLNRAIVGGGIASQASSLAITNDDLVFAMLHFKDNGCYDQYRTQLSNGVVAATERMWSDYWSWAAQGYPAFAGPRPWYIYFPGVVYNGY